jgi:hypothetical protein
MKAIIITNDRDDTGALGLKIVPEGANDRTLMQLLERQYPMIHRSADDESLKVPIASPDIVEYPVSPSLSMSLCSSWAIEPAVTVTVRSDPWRFSSLRGTELRISRPDEWEVIYLVANGRRVPEGAACDIYPGTVVEVTAKNRSARPAVLTAVLGAPGLSSKDRGE